MNRFRKTINWLLGPESPDIFVRLLKAWRLWITGAIFGAFIGMILFNLFPPDHRARATVVVDNNLEQAWKAFPDNARFFFLARETRKLAEVAWADDTLEQVVIAIGNTSVAELRSGKLDLQQPTDGAWHFWAEDSDAGRAQILAAAWAQAFVDNVRLSVEVYPELEAARAALNAEASREEVDLELLAELIEHVSILGDQEQGISQYTQLIYSQATQLPLVDSIQLGTFMFIGSWIGALGLAVFVLFLSKDQKGEIGIG